MSDSHMILDKAKFDKLHPGKTWHGVGVYTGEGLWDSEANGGNPDPTQKAPWKDPDPAQALQDVVNGVTTPRTKYENQSYDDLVRLADIHDIPFPAGIHKHLLIDLLVEHLVPVMKWNRMVKKNSGACDTHKEIYDVDMAMEVWKEDHLEIGARELSMWKQENIRMAIKEGAPLISIKSAFSEICGYCIALGKACEKCPLGRRGEFVTKENKGDCFDDPFFKQALEAQKVEIFAINHAEWCQHYGLWKEHWV